jgi:hypothetical protein
MSGVVGVLAAAIHGSKRLYEFIDGLRGAPRDVSTLAEDLKALYQTLAELARIQDRPAAANVLSEHIKAPLENCLDVFDDFTSTLQSFTMTSRDGALRIRTWKSITWTFKEKEIQLFRDTILTYKSTLQLAIGALSLWVCLFTFLIRPL